MRRWAIDPRRAIAALCALTLLELVPLAPWGCARAQPGAAAGPRVAWTAAGDSAASAPPAADRSGAVRRRAPGSASEAGAQTDQPVVSPAERLDELRRLIRAELSLPGMERARTSVLAAPASGGDPLVTIAPDEHRVPASNAKLLTSVAAVKRLGTGYGFVTEVSRGRASGPLYISGSGDPALTRGDLATLARQVKASGLSEVRGGIVVDDASYGNRRLAPGFESFDEGSHYRPTSGALNVDGNVVLIQVSAPRDRQRPRVDVTPPSDYVVVRKLVRFVPARKRGAKAAEPKIRVEVRAGRSTMLVTVSGTMRRGDPGWSTKRAVADPGLNVGWALLRALEQQGLKVTGAVRRGRRPAEARVVARRTSPLSRVLARVNQHSDNLAAENLVRAMGSLGDGAGGRRAGSWERGLVELRETLAGLGLTEFHLGNGSGLHRRSWVTARLLVSLLQKVHSDPELARAIPASLAVAGRCGTLAGRLRGGAAGGVIRAKTGTLGNALALSGFVDVAGAAPLAFSILVNGRSDNWVRERIDRVAELLASYATGKSFVGEGPEPDAAASQGAASQPAAASQPTDAPAPASQPAAESERDTESPSSEEGAAVEEP